MENNFESPIGVDFEFDEEAELSGFQKFWKKVSPWIRITLALIVIGGLFYISGIYQFLFYQRTPSSVEQEMVSSALDVEMLSLPLTIFVLKNEELYGSRRSKENVEIIVENASRVWQQANIQLQIRKIIFLDKNDNELELFFTNPEEFILKVDDYDYKTVNVFLIGTLNGINGIAFTGLRSAAVADYTTVYDFRALAHEIGHILNLQHVAGDMSSLMFRGANGFKLSLDEITRARNKVTGAFSR